MFKWKKKSIWIILNATPLLYCSLVTGEYTAPYHSPSFLLVTNATRRQKKVVNLQGLFASHRELAEQKEKKTSREMVRLQSWMCPGEMTNGMTCGSINKNVSAMISKDRVLSTFERGSVRVVLSMWNRIISRKSRNSALQAKIDLQYG